MPDIGSTIMTLRAVLTMDTKDFDNGISKSQGSANKFASTLKNTITGAAKAATIALGAATTGIVSLTKTAVSSYADYEQLIGGVETLFGDAAQQVISDAEQAFKSAGMSMNEYMETSIQSAASLINSLDGDQSKAAELMNMSVTDMADNVNKMGTTMEAVQNAYRGFSRGNYTMLDNLALGFAGTKEGMEELLAKAEEISGVEYDISSYADIVEAIHVVQTEMGITGTTAKEASETISGSMNAMKASWTNFMTALANPDADISAVAQQLVESMSTVKDNVMPVIQQVLKSISDAIPQIVPMITEMLPALVNELLPGLLDASVQILDVLLNAFAENTPAIVEALVAVVDVLANTLIDNMPIFLNAIITVVGAIIERMPEILLAVWDAFVQILDSWGILDFFAGLWDGIKQGASDAWEGIKGAFSAVTTWFSDVFSEAWQKVKDVFSTGGKIFSGIKEGIENTFKTVVNAIIRGINTVIAVPFNAINGFLRTLRDVEILGWMPFSWITEFGVPQIPELAKGGVLKRGQVGVLEGNGAEAVVPLEQNKEWIHAVAQDFAGEMGGATTVTINVYGAQGQDINELAEIISRKINDAVSRDRRVFA